MQLSEKLFGGERNCFVGRTKELEMLRKHAAGDSIWPWLHIYGQGGIGKSTLLRQFRSEMESACCYYLDGSRGIRQKEDVLDQMAEQLRKAGEPDLQGRSSDDIVRLMNRRSLDAGSNIVLLIDAFENWRSVDDWLIRWLQQLETAVRIVTAGRDPLTGGWLRSGWASLIYTVQLPALAPLEVERYASIRGILDDDSQSRLMRFSGGIPLAMALAAEVMLRGDGYNCFDRGEQIRLIEVLMHELLRGLPSSVERLFEAASVYWRFNEERLTSIIDEEINTESFRELIRLPFVVLMQDEWMLHDAVRAWALEDLIRRKPNAYEQMRRKGLELIRLEERSNPQLRHKLHMDKMNLHEHPLVRSMFFSGNLDEMELRQCRECDLPAIESLYIRYLNFASPSAAEERHMAWLLRPVWDIDPSSFITIWKGNELIAFYAMIPLNDEILNLFANESLLQPLVQGWKTTPKAFFFSFIGIVPELEGQARAYILNTIINHFSVAEWILDFTCLQEWFPVFEYCGFERATWADAKTESGTEYRAFLLDTSQEDFLTKLDRLLTKRESEENSVKVGIEKAENIQELKKLLKEWHNLSLKPALSETYARLFPHRNSGQTVRNDLLEAINRLMDGNDREVTWGKLLKYAYTQEFGSHERVAERLNLSMATYYRHLNKALERLYQLLAGG